MNPELLLSVTGAKNITQAGKQWEVESEGDADLRPAIFNFAVNNRLTLLTLQEKQQNLENVFHLLTQKKGV